MKKLAKNGFARTSLALLACLALLFLSACGAGGARTDVMTDAAPAVAPAAEEQAWAMDSAAEAEGGADNGAGSPGLTLPLDDRKIIMTADLTLESNEFDASCQKLQDEAQAAGGYVAAASLSAADQPGSRTAYYTLRIPAEKYSAFMDTAISAGNLMYRNEYAQDVTDQYVDVEARLKSLRAQEARLLEMMDETAKLSDIIEVQNQLTQVQYEIESWVASQRSLDQMIAYSTINVTVIEVRQLTEIVEDSYFAKLGKAFADGWKTTARVLEQLTYGLAAIVPLLVLAGVILVVVLLLVRRSRKKRAQMPQPLPYQNMGAPPATDATPTAMPDAPGSDKPDES